MDIFIIVILHFPFSSTESNIGKEKTNLTIITTTSTLMREIALNNAMKEDSQILIARKTIDHSMKGSLSQKEVHFILGRGTKNLHRTEDFNLITNHVERSGTHNI